jgi:hypothetical protein
MPAESPNVIDNSRYYALCRQLPVASQRVDQALFSEFFICVVERLRYSVGIDRQGVSRAEGPFLYKAVPVAEQPQYSAR